MLNASKMVLVDSTMTIGGVLANTIGRDHTCSMLGVAFDHTRTPSAQIAEIIGRDSVVLK